MSQPTIDEILDEVERLDKEGTKKPWFRSPRYPDIVVHGDPEDVYASLNIANTIDSLEDADTDLIAYFRNHAPALVAEVRRLRRDLATADKQARADSARFAKEREDLRAQIEDRRSRYRELAREAGYTGDTAEHRDVMTWAKDQKALVASLRARADVPYRPGLPSVEQVRTHEGNGGWWQWRWTDAKGEPAFQEQLRLSDGRIQSCTGGNTWGSASISQRIGWRPCSPDGTPIPWPEE